MNRKRMTLLAVCLLSLAFATMVASAADKPPERRVINPLVYKSLQYSFPDQGDPQLGAARYLPPPEALGSAAPSASPGAVIGDTWYDYQHNCTMGRMNETEGGGGKEVAHFSWMYLPGPVLDSREYYYNAYNITDGAFLGATGLQSDDEYAGYVAMSMTNDGRAVVGGHNREAADNLYDGHFYWDFANATGFFGYNDQVPRALAEVAGDPGDEMLWPKFVYVQGPGENDTVLHVIQRERVESGGDPARVCYFRRVGSDDTLGTWDPDVYVIDTIYTTSHEVTANDAGKVAIIWTANLPCPGDPDPLASGYECRQFVQWDNDVYYETSDDYGVTWNGRVNITNNILTEGTQDGYRPYGDISSLLDTDGDLHIVWNARFWPADANAGGQAGLLRARLFHWSEETPYVRTVHSADWDQTTCNGGAWQLNVSKEAISECNGRFYVVFVQFNDIPGGVEDDCADEGNPGYPVGAANGELWMAVSNDDGLTWDQARNLTNTYTPGCDSATGVGGPCASDHWPSVTRLGRNVPLNPGDTVTDVLVPAPGPPTGWYLDVQYMEDKSAGGIVQDEGTWQLADVKWFRLDCVPHVQNPLLGLSPPIIDFPAWGKPGVQKDTAVTIENLGNATLSYSIVEEEDTGTPGWLSTSGFSGTVSSGLNNTETGIVSLNTGGVETNVITLLQGRLIFNSNAPTTPDTLPIRYWVADTLYPPEIDTISTTCINLAVVNNGSFGQQGIGRVNMDYVGYPTGAQGGDCDTNATDYVYDGSPVVGWIEGSDTIMNWSVFGTTYLDSVGFVQISNTESVNDGEHDYYTAKFLTNDSSIAIEKTWFAPQDQVSDTCNFIIQCLKIYENDDQDHLGITVGEAIDWDVPSDSGTDNGSGTITSKNLIYQQGGEYNQDDTTECVDNDTRYAAMMFLQMLKKADTFEVIDDGEGRPFHGAYTADNATYVYGNTNGFDPGELYEKMQDGGYSLYSSANPDSAYVDLHTVMTFVNNYDLLVGETLIVYLNLITVEDGGGQANLETYADMDKAWFCGHLTPVGCGCCENRGNVDGLFDGEFPVTVADLTYLVAFLFSGGPEPPCEEEGNVDSLFDGEFPVTVADLTYLVAFLFSGGPPPPPC